MANQTPSDDLDDALLTTQDIIEDARRPVLIARHRDLLKEVESGISDAFVSGSSEHPRFQAMLRELMAPSEQSRIAASLTQLAEDQHYEGMNLADAIVDYCSLLRERQGVEVATLQLHIIGIYRHIRKLMLEQQALVPDLSDLRTLPSDRLARLLAPLPIAFGTPGLQDGLVITSTQQDRILNAVRRLLRAEGGDETWHEAGGDPPLPREVEEPLRDIPTERRVKARAALVADRIRSRFYRAVFLKYFDRDSLGQEELSAHKTLLHWLESIRDTPHLYPFMQGQTASQKTFRLGRLLRKVIQLNEIYQRVALAAAHPSYREKMASMNMRDRLSLVAKDRYPALKVDPQFLLTTALCPFSTLASWVQDKVASKDFILPPDAKE